MKSEKLLGAIGNIDDNLIYSAVNDTSKKKRTAWVNLGAIAACLCIMACIFAVPRFVMQSVPTGTSPTGANAGVGQIQSLSETEEIYVEIVEWKKTGFAAVVVDAGNNSVFLLDGELTVEFDDDTKIILNDGTAFEFNLDEPNTESIGWEIGTIVKVEFTEYDEYLEGNHFYNRLLASSAEAAASEQ